MSEFTPKYAGSNATVAGVVVEKHGKPTIIHVSAALAAAAPDLLEACKALLVDTKLRFIHESQRMGVDYDTAQARWDKACESGMLGAAQAAIKKATQ